MTPLEAEVFEAVQAAAKADLDQYRAAKTPELFELAQFLDEHCANPEFSLALDRRTSYLLAAWAQAAGPRIRARMAGSTLPRKVLDYVLDVQDEELEGLAQRMMAEAGAAQ